MRYFVDINWSSDLASRMCVCLGSASYPPSPETPFGSVSMAKMTVPQFMLTNDATRLEFERTFVESFPPGAQLREPNPFDGFDVGNGFTVSFSREEPV